MNVASLQDSTHDFRCNDVTVTFKCLLIKVFVFHFNELALCTIFLCGISNFMYSFMYLFFFYMIIYSEKKILKCLNCQIWQHRLFLARLICIWADTRWKKQKQLSIRCIPQPHREFPLFIQLFGIFVGTSDAKRAGSCAQRFAVYYLGAFFKRLVSICKSSRRSFCLLLNYWKKSPTSALLARRHRPLSIFSGCFMSRFLKCCRASAQPDQYVFFFIYQKSYIRRENVGNKQKPVEV